MVLQESPNGIASCYEVILRDIHGAETRLMYSGYMKDVLMELQSIVVNQKIMKIEINPTNISFVKSFWKDLTNYRE